MTPDDATPFGGPAPTWGEGNADPDTGTTAGSQDPTPEPAGPDVTESIDVADPAGEPAPTPDAQPEPPTQPLLPFEIPQPEPWQPSDDDLDPTADTGWERAADHELVAVRPEDVPTLLAIRTDGPLEPAVVREVIANRAPGRAQPPTAAASGWANAGEPTVAAGAADATTAAGSIPASAGIWSPPAAPAPGSAPTAPTQPGNVIDFPQAAPEVALAPSERRWRRASRRVRGGLEAAARPVLLAALFVLGVSVGWVSYVGTRPPPAAAPVAVLEPGTTTDVPPQVQSLIAAMNADDQSQVQLVVPSDAYRILAGALAEQSVKSIRGAKALWTYSNGQDSATEILLSVTTQDDQNFTFNLVVHLHGGVIAEFR